MFPNPRCMLENSNNTRNWKATPKKKKSAHVVNKYGWEFIHSYWITWHMTTKTKKHIYIYVCVCVCVCNIQYNNLPRQPKWESWSMKAAMHWVGLGVKSEQLYYLRHVLLICTCNSSFFKNLGLYENHGIKRWTKILRPKRQRKGTHIDQ